MSRPWLTVDGLADRLVALFRSARMGPAERAVAAVDMAGELLCEAVAADALSDPEAQAIRESLIAALVGLNRRAPVGPPIGARVVANTGAGTVAGRIAFHASGALAIRRDDTGALAFAAPAGVVRMLEPSPAEGGAA